MDQEYQNILVPVDGSKESELALERAIFVAKRNGAHVDVLNVIDTRAMAYNFAGMSDGSIAYQLVDKSKEYLSKLLKEARRRMTLTTWTSTFGWAIRRRLSPLTLFMITTTT